MAVPRTTTPPKTATEWAAHLKELTARVDSGRVYDRDLPALAGAVRGLIEALNRHDKTGIRLRW